MHLITPLGVEKLRTALHVKAKMSCSGGIFRLAVLNRKMRGWASYFRLGPVSKAYRAIDEHARSRLRQWLRAKQNVPGRVEARFPDKYLHGDLGLLHSHS